MGSLLHTSVAPAAGFRYVPGMISSKYRGAVLVCALAACITAARADERLAGIACRSVHLGYSAPACDRFETEVVVRQSQPGTYFCAIGFNMGYFGIQELADGRKIALFSVWDPTRGDNPSAVPEESRVLVAYQDPAATVRRFGGEGTGAQALYPFDWKTNTAYRFRVDARVVSNRTAFAGYLLEPGAADWKHLATFETIGRGLRIEGEYSFVEDFRRNRESLQRERRALFGPARAISAAGATQEVRRAQFTADGNPALNIDAGTYAGRFYLATGGAVTNTGARLWSQIDLPAEARR
jgi:hypothetical protein